MAKIIRAVAGILKQNNHVFMVSRPQGKVYAGSWEFPGGKVEADETIELALVRELREEVGILVDTKDCIKLTKLYQSYEHGDVELDVYLVSTWRGEPQSLEGQDLHWHDLSKICLKKPLLITTQKILDIIKK